MDIRIAFAIHILQLPIMNIVFFSLFHGLPIADIFT